MKKDYYELLGADRSASTDELKKAYRKLAMKYHPDRNQGDKVAEQKFKEISEAYDVLKDTQRRAAYDQYGHAAFEGGMGGGAGARSGGFDFSGGGFADIFDEMFGDAMGMRGGGHSQGVRGHDLRFNLEISLEDAFDGKQTTIRVPTQILCDSCDGSGAKTKKDIVDCPTCSGRGKVRMQQGFFTLERTCGACHGQGKSIKNLCKGCSGEGRIRHDETLSVSIPAGIEASTQIRLTGKGEAGEMGGPPGDLYIFVTIQPHKFFRREGAHLYCRVPITMKMAALGCDVEVPTINRKKARVAIPEGTQSGSQFKLRGKGMKVMNHHAHGDMYVEIAVETPVNLSDKQKELLKEFEECDNEGKSSPESKGFFDRIVKLWDDIKEA